MSRTMTTLYDTDVIAWVDEQVALLRAGQFSKIDVEHIIEEIEDVGGSERRELRHRLSVLLSHLMKWKCQPARRDASWRRTIGEQRRAIEYVVKKTPGLKPLLQDQDWLAEVFRDAVVRTLGETNREELPALLPWTITQVMDHGFLPD